MKALRRERCDSWVFLLVSLLVASTGFACTKSFDGAKFLKAAASRGLAFKSPEKCLTAELQNNTFFAPPDTACKLVMPNAGWLGDGFTFQGIQASGRFGADPKSDGIHITVHAGGGMKFNFVAVTTATPGCETLSVDDVFIGAVRATNPPSRREPSPTDEQRREPFAPL